MDVSDDPTSFDSVALHEHAGTLEIQNDAPDTTKDGYDTLGLESEHDTFTHTEASQQEMEQFLLSAGVEVSEGNHGKHADAGVSQELELDMEVEGGHDHHGALMEGILDLASHELHGDDHLHLDLEPHQEPATFDLHQIHQELNDATSLSEHHHDSADASAAQPDTSVLGEEATCHPSLDRTLFDSNLAPSPNDRGLPLVPHLQEEPVPTGIQIVNEEVLVNDIGLSPMGEGLPSTEAMGMVKQEAELVAEQVQGQHFDATSQQPGRSAAEMLKTPSGGNPPLPIDHALTEPITAFYKLQFLEPPPAQSSGSHNDYRPKEAFSYYMQTLDVTIGRKINRLKKAVLDQPLQPRASADEEMGPGTEGMKVEHDGQTPTAKEAEHDVKVESSAVFQEQSVMTKNNDGGNAPEDGKRSTPPDVPPAKEIAKPPIDDQPPQQDIADAPESEHNKSLIMGRGAEEEDIQTSIRIIKSESNHKVVSGRDGVHGEDMDERQVDVDLGALKSVSRLHARIGYSYTLSQFYLDVLGRNGAWVDDVFKVKGSRVALGPYTKIQISTRTFYFILPPASIASYPIPLNHNALTGPGVESLGFGVTGPKVPSQPAVSDNENDLHHLFQRPATFNAFSTNREEWEDERMGLFGMGKGMGKNGAYGYRSRHRKGRKCRKCKLQESEHKDEHREDLDHSFSGSDNEHGNGEDSNDSVCSCSRCASEQEWFSSSVDSDADESSELSSVSDSDEESDVDSSSEESDGADEHEEKEEEEEDAQQNTADPYKATEAPIKEVPEVKGNATEDSTKQGERGVADDKGVVVPSTEAMEPSVQSDSVMAASDAESEEETLASKLKVAELLKPTASRLPAPPQFSDDQASHMHLEDSSHLPPTEADIQAVQDLIASTMTPTDEQGMPLQTPQSGMPYDNSMFSSLDSSHVPMEGEGLVPVPEVKLTKAEKSALAARIREAKAAARKEEQERKKAEKAAQREKDKAEKAKAKADAAAAKAAKKQKAEALEREKMLARMESMQQPQADDYTMDVLDIPANSSADTAHTGVSSYPPGVRPGMPRPAATTGQGLVRPGMPGVRPARPMPNGYRPVNATGPNAMAAPGFRPLRPGLNGMPIRPGMSGVRPGMSGPSIRPGPGSVPPLQAQMRPGMQARPPQPGLRPVRPGPPIRPGSRPILPPQRPPLQPHMNSGSFGESRDGSRGMSPDAMSIHSQEGLSRSPSLDPHSQKRISPLLGIDGQPFIGPDPIKPDLTYATIIYRALANVDRGRGTLGQVCDWVAKEWEWFRMNPESGWQNSIRHNLSLNKAFLKVPRVPEDDPESKGSVWILDPVHAPELVERERKAAEQKEARAKRDSDKGPNIVKPMKPRKPTDGMLRRDSDDHARPSPSPAPSNAPAANSVEAILGSLIPPLLVPLNRQLPLVLGAIPPHLKSVDIKIKHLLPEPPYVFDNNTIILNPLVFGRFSKQQLAQMQALPTKSAITVLRTYVLRWLQEKVKKLGPASLPRLGNPAIRPTAAGPGSRPPGGIPIARPGVVPRPQGIRPTPGQVRPVAAGVRPAIARPGIAPRPLPNGGVSARPAIRPGASAARPAPRPINGNATGARPPTPALDPETLRKITQLAESAIKTNSAQSANAKVLLQYLKQVGSHVNIAIATQILSTGVIPPNAIPVRPTQIAGTGGTGIPSIRPGIRPPAVTPRPNPTTVLGKRPVEASSGSVTDSADAKRQKV